MDTVTFKGLEFVPYLTREQIAEQVQRVAAEIRRDCKSENPIFLCVLNGAFMFAADLFRACQMNHAEITFIRFKSYEGTSSTGKVREIMGLSEDIQGREVIIIEDIVDTGVTAFQLRQMLLGRNPRSVKMATLLFKPESLQLGTPPEYVGFEIPSKFIIGYGLDLDGEARNLSDIYVVK
jgi:hypoxanthine phosphoribosyltransferase